MPEVLPVTDDVLDAIARLRRAMPRNADVMLICYAAERAALATLKPKFDKTAYMRRYMRKRRAEEKAAKVA